MPDTFLTITPPSLPAGYCMPGTVQAFVDDIFEGAHAILPDALGQIFISSNTPSVEYRDRIWFKTNTTNSTVTGIFRWAPTYGLWLQNHWQYNGCVVPTYERRIFVGTLTQLETYSGGEAGTVSDTTGSFWQEDTVMRDCWPIGTNTTIATVYTAANIFDTATPDPPTGIGVYFIKPSGRIFDRG